MKIILKWIKKTEIEISGISYSPINNKIIISSGKKIIFLDGKTGKEINKCEKHTEEITTLSFRKDGKFFASGGKDNIVYFWDVNDISKPKNKIRLNDPIIKINYCPCLMILIAISKKQIAICKEKSVVKIPLNNFPVDFCWTNDGLKFAIAFENGIISIRDKDKGNKDEKIIKIYEDKIEKINCCLFSNHRFLNKDYCLYTCTNDHFLHLIDLFNTNVNHSIKLSNVPICISLYKNDYVLIGTNNSEISFFSKDGFFILNIKQGLNNYVKSIINEDKNDFIFSISNNSVICHQIHFNIIHGIYNEKYVYRKNLREIIIHILTTGEIIKIETKKYIKKLAVFNDLVAYQSNDRVYVHQISDDDNTKPKYCIKWEDDISILLLASNHLIICYENFINLYYLAEDEKLISIEEREWNFETSVKYLRILPGPPKREGMLCGTRLGEIYMIYLDNKFPILYYTHDLPIKSLDLNSNRKKLAIIDYNYEMTIINLNTKAIISKGIKAKTLSFNSDIEDMIAYWYKGFIFIKTSDFAPIKEKVTGVIIGFTGKKVYLLQTKNVVFFIDISNGQSILKYAERKQIKEAYKIACLGATNEEWLFLGIESLLNFDFKISKNCFMKIKDMKLINLANEVEEEKLNGTDFNVLRGIIYSNIGKYKRASDFFIKGGKPEKSQEMYATLKMYAQALEIRGKYMKGYDNIYSDEILCEQAEWLNKNKKFKEAAELYRALGKKTKAIEIYGENNLLDDLIEYCRELSPDVDHEAISLCGFFFKKNKNYTYAYEAYLKLGDNKSLVFMNIELEKWDEAFILSNNNKYLHQYVHLKYAENLILEDKFNEAQENYRKAERVDLSMKLLHKLINNAIFEKRFKDVSNLFVSYTKDALYIIKEFRLDIMKLSKSEYAKKKEFLDSIELSDIFNAYDYIYKFIEEPFNLDLINYEDKNLFNACLFLVNKISSFNSSMNELKLISLSHIYYSLAILSKKMNCFKISIDAYNKLEGLNYPQKWSEQLEMEILEIRGKNYEDNNEIELPKCYNCLHENPLINKFGDKCFYCSAPFKRCSLTFEILPLVEFKPKKGISSDFAINFIKMTNLENIKKNIVKSFNDDLEEVYTLKIDDNKIDLFEEKMNGLFTNKESSNKYKVLILDETILKSLNENEVFIIDLRKINRTYPVKFYKNRRKDISIIMCKNCYKFFKMEEYENAFIKNGNCCPICKYVDEDMIMDDSEEYEYQFDEENEELEDEEEEEGVEEEEDEKENNKISSNSSSNISSDSNSNSNNDNDKDNDNSKDNNNDNDKDNNNDNDNDNDIDNDKENINDNDNNDNDNNNDNNNDNEQSYKSDDNNNNDNKKNVNNNESDDDY